MSDIIFRAKPTLTDIKAKPMSFDHLRHVSRMPTIRAKVKFPFAKVRKQELGSSIVHLAGSGTVKVTARRNPGGYAYIVPTSTTSGEKQPGWVCSSARWSGEVISPEMAILNPNYSSMYPGAVYDYTHIADGSYKLLPYARKPLTVTVDGQKFSKPAFRINTPTRAGYNSALAAIKGGQNVQGGSRSVGTAYEVLAEEDLYLRTAGSGYYLGFGGSHALEYKSSSKSHKYFLNIIQAYYTVSVDDSVNEPSDFFVMKTEQPNNADAVSDAALDPNWVFVESVTYGRLLQVMFESDQSFSSVGLDIEAHANLLIAGGEASLNYQQKSLLDKTAITVASIGGDAGASAKIATSTMSQLKGRIDAFFSGSNDEEPIAYSLRTLDGAVVGSHMITEFTSRQCTPQPSHYLVTWKDVLCIRSDDQDSTSNPEDCRLMVRIRAWDGSGKDILDTAKVNQGILAAEAARKQAPGLGIPVPWTYVRGNEDHPVVLGTGERRDMSSLKLKFPVKVGDSGMKIGIRADVLEYDGFGDANDDFADEVKFYTVGEIGNGREVSLMTTDEDSRIEFHFRIEPLFD